MNRRHRRPDARAALRAAVGRRWMLFAALAVWASACGSEPVDAPPPASAPADAEPPTPVSTSAVPEVFVDLLAQAQTAHVSRVGPVIGPDAPGWRRVAELGGRGPWSPPRTIDGRAGSWLDGIGGSVHFPLGPEAAKARVLELWLRPVARGQVVSIFFDEEPVTTTRVRSGWKRYRFPIPVEVTPGEHSVRFWFRFTRHHGRLRTPAAFGGLRLLPPGEEPAPAEAWQGTLAMPGLDPEPALLAGPPTTWSWYVLPPQGGRLLTRAAVVEGEPVEFVVRVEVDGAPASELRRMTVAAGSVAELDVALEAFAGRPVRLVLETVGAGGAPSAVARAGWLSPRILMPGRPRSQPRAARNLIVWAVDGLRDDRPALGRAGNFAATPNLDLLAAEGAAAIDIWSGGASAGDGHRRLLQPDPEGPSLAAAMRAAGKRTGFLSASTAVDPAWIEDFDTRLDLQRAGEPAETRILLREIESWLYVRKRDPFFLYVSSANPRTPLRPPKGYRQLYDRARPLRAETRRSERLADIRDLRIAYDAEVSATDYWVGQLLALLQTQGVADDTALIVVGSVGQELREAGGLGDGHALVPQVFRVPLVAWHPHLRSATPGELHQGGELADIGALALRFVGGDADGWSGRDPTGHLFSGLPLPPRPDRARHGNQVAVRFGPWLLRGAGVRGLELWDLRVGLDPDLELSANRPIALRTLRDSLQ